MGRIHSLLVVSAGFLALTGCDRAGAPAGDGDCNARLRIDGTVYAFHPDAVTVPPEPVTTLGPVDVLDCDREVVDSAVAVQMDGVPTSVAVAVVEDMTGVYVAEGTDPSDWPEPLRR